MTLDLNQTDCGALMNSPRNKDISISPTKPDLERDLEINVYSPTPSPDPKPQIQYCSDKDVNEIKYDNYDLVGDISKQLDTLVNEIPKGNEDLNFELSVPQTRKTVGF